MSRLNLLKKQPYKLLSRTIEVTYMHHINNLYDPPLAKEKFKETIKETTLRISK